MGLPLATIGLVGFAHAADVLPTTKPAPSQPENCFASVWSFLDSTAADCPLTYRGFTLYATLDAGLMYNTNGAPWNPAYVNGTHGLISKQSNGPKWLWSPNNINQSIIGIKMSKPIADGWSLVGTLEAGFDPLSGYLADSQRAQVMNNGKPLALQSVNGNLSRAGQWDNSQFFLGLSNKTYGTLTGGRVNALSLDGLIAYDPMGTAYAFSPFGFTGMYAGFATPNSRAPTPRSNIGENSATSASWDWRRSAATTRATAHRKCGRARSARDIHNLYGGTLSLDFVGSYAVDGVLTSNLHNADPDILFHQRPEGDAFQQRRFPRARQVHLGSRAIVRWLGIFPPSQPDRRLPNGFKTIGSYSVPGNILDNKAFPTVWITTNAFNIQRVYNTIWTGFKYAVNDRLDVMRGRLLRLAE